MKVNEDNETVAAVDLEVPGAGELMGGSQREEDYTKLVNRMKEMNEVDIAEFIQEVEQDKVVLVFRLLR